MAKIMVTWLGEDELHDPLPGPSFTMWGGTKFEKGKSVLVDSEKPGISGEEKLIIDQIILKAPKSRYFKTEAYADRQERPSKG